MTPLSLALEALGYPASIFAVIAPGEPSPRRNPPKRPPTTPPATRYRRYVTRGMDSRRRAEVWALALQTDPNLSISALAVMSGTGSPTVLQALRRLGFAHGRRDGYVPGYGRPRYRRPRSDRRAVARVPRGAVPVVPGRDE